MANLLPPASPYERRRGSLQPHLNSLSPPADLLRRLTCPSVRLREQQRVFLNKQVGSSSHTDDSVDNDGTTSPGIIDAVNKVFFKPWYSEESLMTEGKSVNGSQQGSSTSLKTISPLMTRKDIDEFDFIIPRPSISLHKQISIRKEPTSLGKIDVTHYPSNDETQELQEVGTKLRVGEAKFCIVYNTQESKLKLTLKSVCIFAIPSASVVGCNWVCETTTFIELLPDKKKAMEINYDQEHLIDIKADDVTTKTIRLTFYDNRRKHMKNPIGHVVFPLREVPNLNKINVHSRRLTFHSQPAGFNKGKLSISLSWAVSAQRLEVKIGKASNLKHEHGVQGKEFYLKMTVFMLENKHKVFKTSIVKATPDVNFREKFILPFTSPQLKDSTLTFRMYVKGSSKKRLVTKILTGRTVIGPYMNHNDRTLSQWEKMITNPMEEITEDHTLYL